jgi:simple sugar transport system permease protein
MSGPELAGLLLPLGVAALRQATPLVLAGLGGICSERVGIVNIALEGMMLAGAFTGLVAGRLAGPLVGVLAAVTVGMLVGLTHLWATRKFRLNHIVSGVAINLLALHSTTFLLRRLFNQADPPVEARIESMLPTSLFTGVALALVLVFHLVLYYTPLGLRIRAVGESEASTRMAGVDTARVKMLGLAASGVLAGLAGAYLSLAQVGRFSDDMVSGRGFIALAAVVCGRWTPLGMAAASLAFGALDALQFHLQGSVALPGELLRSIPYIATVVAAMALRPRPPADLGRQEE